MQKYVPNVAATAGTATLQGLLRPIDIVRIVIIAADTTPMKNLRTFAVCQDAIIIDVDPLPIAIKTSRRCRSILHIGR
jgi:hypothetical protein